MGFHLNDHNTAWARTFPLIKVNLDRAKESRLDQENRRRDRRYILVTLALEAYRRKYNKMEAACLPQNQDIYEFEELRDFIDTDIPMGYEDAIDLVNSIAKDLRDWGIKRKSSILALNSLDQTSFQLATTTFTCLLPNSRSLITLHEEEVFSWRGTDPEDLPTVDIAAQAVVLRILDLLGLDPAITTREALDGLGCKFLCLNCLAEAPKRQSRLQTRLEQSKPLTWRTAVGYGLSFRIDVR